jgi:hypothetical protein
MEQSEEPVSSSNRRVHREEREGNGGGGRLGAAWRKGNGREREGSGHGGRQRGMKEVARNGPWPSSAGGGIVARTRESSGARAMRR